MEGAEEEAINDFLSVLEEHRRSCERQGKYIEAEIAKNRLEELKLHEENRRREAMRSRQIAERLGVEEAHMLEFQQFNLLWDRNMSEYERHAEELVAAMKERHASELQEFQRRLMEKQTRPKFSKELLNLRRIEQHLGKAMEYASAHKMKLKADTLEAWELERWQNQRQQELFQKEAKFKMQKQMELVALQKRIQTGREEQKKQRQMDLERLLQRYQNVKSELEAQQNLERIRAEKMSQVGSMSLVSRRKTTAAQASGQPGPGTPSAMAASAAGGGTPAAAATGEGGGRESGGRRSRRRKKRSGH